MMDFNRLERSVWDVLRDEKRPIALYGMGDGADKVLNEFEARGIRAAAVFASDGFVRGHSFRGFPVETLSGVTERLSENIVIVICFASQRPELLRRFTDLDARYDVFAPDVPVVPGPVFDAAFARQNQAAMARAYELLADERSRQVFLDTVRFKLSGRLRYLFGSETEKAEAFENLLCLGENEHFADLGAYTGDTVREFLHHTKGRYASITALEPDARSFRKFSAYAAENLTGEIHLVQAGAWREDTTLTFAAKAGRQSRVAREGVKTEMRALDSVLNGAPCTYLKMDVEGAERQAIAGARETIRRFGPALNIAAYHTSADFFELPLLIHEINPAYRLYLRHHPYVPAWDTNLYAAAR